MYIYIYVYIIGLVPGFVWLRYHLRGIELEGTRRETGLKGKRKGRWCGMEWIYKGLLWEVFRGMFLGRILYYILY